MSDTTNTADYLDSRDLEERIVKLADMPERDSVEHTELLELEKLRDQYIDSFGRDSWNFGAQFIRDSYFEYYARELADDTGAINSDMTWPNNCIDWEQAARELQMDYTEFDYDGVTYWAREA